eukprot:m.203018 g.203018  ORF g.203018 m.203018 type:complete len:197 (+) comp25994_c1_seq6:70-660(+)
MSSLRPKSPPSLSFSDSLEFRDHCAEKNDAAATRALLARHGNNPNLLLNWCDTSLVVCAGYYNAPAVVETLLQAGADINATDRDGWTGLIMASFNGQFEVAKVLVAAGADLNLHSKDGKTALSISQQFSHAKIVALLKRPPHWTLVSHQYLLLQPNYCHNIKFLVWCMQHVKSYQPLPFEMVWHVLGFLKLSELNQ